MLTKGGYTHFLSVELPHMKIKKSAWLFCVYCALIFSAQDTTHKDHLSHSRSRISSSEPEISRDQMWSTVTNGNNPSLEKSRDCI